MKNFGFFDCARRFYPISIRMDKKNHTRFCRTFAIDGPFPVLGRFQSDKINRSNCITVSVHSVHSVHYSFSSFRSFRSFRSLQFQFICILNRIDWSLPESKIIIQFFLALKFFGIEDIRLMNRFAKTGLIDCFLNKS